MILGGDTGFLIGIASKADSALIHWQRVLAGDDDLILSPLSVCEFLVYQYKRGHADAARRSIARMRSIGNIAIVPPDNAVAERAAGYRHGLDLPTVDAFILATFVSQGCDVVLSTDGHFRLAGARAIIPVEMLA